jgi:ATP-binding cassette, subfamily F, member 3
MQRVPTLHATSLAKSYGADALFRDVSFRLAPGQRLALVGRNGSGKTTLLRILAGELQADNGDVAYPRSMRIALHDQRPPRHAHVSLAAYVAEGLADIHTAEAQLATLEGEMAAGAHDDATMRAYAAAQADLEKAGGYAWRARLASILRGLGFRDEHADRSLDSFSGGELTRASLARALASRPDLLLLDEPTNHLDLASLEWLERELVSLDAAILVVSHDRWFLESVTTGVIEIDQGRARTFPGSYSAYREQKALAVAQQQEAFERQQQELARLRRFVDKWRAGTKAKQAQSVKRRIDKAVLVARPRTQQALAFGFPKTVRPGRVVLEAESLRITAGQRLLIRDGSFALERGQRVALIGPNGAGKTTLIDGLVDRQPLAGGRVKIGHNVTIAYFTQHAEDLDDRQTIVESLCAATPLNQGQARTLLGRFLFSGDTADRKVGVLSGGERRRLSLARLVANGANLLVLDEPTNHLDVESREALEDALDAYDGTILFVSHDRALIDAVATETLSIEDQLLVLRAGDYNDYLAARAVADPPARSTPPTPTPATPPPVASTPPARAATPRPAVTAQRRKPSQRLLRTISDLEAKITEAEAEITLIESQLADPAVAADYELLQVAAEKHRAKQEEHAWLLRSWEEAVEAAGV